MVDRNFLANNRAALVANGTYTIDEIIALTVPKNAIAQAQVRAEINADLAQIAIEQQQVTADGASAAGLVVGPKAPPAI